MAILVAGKPDHRERCANALGPFAARHIAHLEPEGDILGRGHVRKQRVALEHDPEPAFGRMDRGQILALQPDRAAGGIEEARDHLQGRGLAAAGGAEKGDELPLPDRETEVVDDSLRSELLGDPFELEIGHRTVSGMTDQRSTSRFQRLVHSSRFSLMTVQSGL
ncbi:hypothetical protein ACVWZK_002768 [Bradyrhizobium sp. GM0.4]